MQYLKSANYKIYLSFLQSSKNSCIFKYTGLKDRGLDCTEEPKLTDGKEIINGKCGHSMLYKCYADNDMCMLCDLNNMDCEGYL